MTMAIAWPPLPSFEDSLPEAARRGWGQLSFEERYRTQHNALLTVAAELAVEKGVGRTTIADIASAAKVSNRTFYEHFATKDECFAVLFRRAAVHAARVVMRAAEKRLAEGPRVVFTTMLTTWAEVLHEGGESVPALWEETRAAGSGLRREFDACVEILAGIFGAVAQQLGSPLPKPELAHVSSILLTGAINVLTPLRLAGDLKPKEVAASARLLCRGFGLDDS